MKYSRKITRLSFLFMLVHGQLAVSWGVFAIYDRIVAKLHEHRKSKFSIMHLLIMVFLLFVAKMVY